MAAPANLFPLKLVVISLGLLLVGGTIFVFAAIASKAGAHSQACKDITVELHLTGKDHVTALMPQGDNVTITLIKNNNNQLLTVDRCSGTILQTLTVKP